ncbi:hypothetical protein EIP91_009986 [Steccherinum ochraceum]|uniref:F-box domain-containing protein n=1 Tax=Steccherinum ochraceum TaxID=92696 RepID=A0A4R0RNC6_9APHY|nr:hypothetical protein EIP91_009986 [Steccherinum ochraceum]
MESHLAVARLPRIQSDIPPEILSQIFILTTGEGWQWHRWSRNSLIALTHVCKYWRSVATQTPFLWRYIIFRGDDDEEKRQFVEAQLARSAQLPLLCVVGLVGSDADHALVRSMLPRAEDLLIQPSTEDPLPSGTLDAPMLKALTFAEDISRWNTSALPIPHISPLYPLPHLQSLDLSCAWYRDMSPFFRPTMRSLRILPTTPDPLGPSVIDVLNALSGMPLLERLEISYMFDTYRPFFQGLPVVQLPHLQELDIHDELYASVTIFDHLAFPISLLLAHEWDVDFHDNGNFPDRDDADLTAKAFVSILDKLSGHHIIGDVPPFPIVRLTVRRALFQALLQVQSPDEPENIDFTYLSSYDEADMAELLRRLLSMSQKQFLAGIRLLFLSAEDCWDHSHHLPFVTGFTEFTRLEILSISHLPGIWHSLASRHEQASRLPFPNLRALHLEWVDMRGFYPIEEPVQQDDFILILSNMLRIRQKAGLELNHLRMQGVAGFAGADDMEMLGGYVGDLHVQCRDGERYSSCRRS